MELRSFHIASTGILLFLLAAGCAVHKKLDSIKAEGMAASIATASDDDLPDCGDSSSEKTVRQSIEVVSPEGEKLILMKAIKDENGEMVATETLDAATVTARFRNVAERLGKVDLCFEIRVPSSMQDPSWQLRFSPTLIVQDDSTAMEPVFITGKDYRRKQLRGYEQYNRFIRSIISDTTKLVDIRSLEIFLERNLPKIYAFKSDSSKVSDSEFVSYFGVSESEAVEHYTNMFLKKLNDRKKSLSGKMYSRYVKVPIEKEGIRLDTVMMEPGGDFVYRYTQTIRTRPRLKKVQITLSGDIWDDDRCLYTMPKGGPLTFYISSLSSFADRKERYLRKIIERSAAVKTVCYVDFRSGSAEIDLDLSRNRSETERIHSNIIQLLQDSLYDLDSIVITASASPEGRENANLRLSKKRAAAVASYFNGLTGNSGTEFRSRSNGENWEMLSLLIDRDSTLSRSAVQKYMGLMSIRDADKREEALSRESFYPYLRKYIYPRLRTVRFGFFLHRKGMVKDTLITTEIDSVYTRGIEALDNQEYEKALDLLKEYRDLNTAIAYMSLDYNASAMAVLQEQPSSPKVKYLKAILYSRASDDETAVKEFLEACNEDRSLVFRGNLDPEIHALIEQYSLENIMNR